METRLMLRRPDERGGKKFLKPVLALAFLLGSVLCANAWADRGGGHHEHPGFAGQHPGFAGRHHGRSHAGVFIGAPLFWGPAWYGDPYYDYPYYDYPYDYRYRPLMVVPEPPVYVERDVTPANSLWYFCGNPEGYYPYVKQCSMPWRVVTPQSVTR